MKRLWLMLATVGIFGFAMSSDLPGQPTEWAEKFNQRFERRPPLRDAQVFDGLTAFDEQGEKLDFESLKGKHTVIVFGCLT